MQQIYTGLKTSDSGCLCMWVSGCFVRSKRTGRLAWVQHLAQALLIGMMLVCAGYGQPKPSAYQVEQTSQGLVITDAGGVTQVRVNNGSLLDGEGKVLASLPAAQNQGTLHTVALASPSAKGQYYLVHYSLQNNQYSATHYSVVALGEHAATENQTTHKLVDAGRGVQVLAGFETLEAPGALRIAVTGSLASGWVLVAEGSDVYSYQITVGNAGGKPVSSKKVITVDKAAEVDAAPKDANGTLRRSEHSYAFLFKQAGQLLVARDGGHEIALHTFNDRTGKVSQATVLATPRLNLGNGYTSRSGQVYGPLDGSRPETAVEDTAWLAKYKAQGIEAPGGWCYRFVVFVLTA